MSAMNLEQFLNGMFSADQVAQMQKQEAEKSSILEGAAFGTFVVPFAEGKVTTEQLSNCTYRHVVKFLNHPTETLTAHEWRVTSFDWFSSQERARAIQQRGISARTYAQALVTHKNIVLAETALLAPPATAAAATATAAEQATPSAAAASSSAAAAAAPVSVAPPEKKEKKEEETGVQEAWELVAQLEEEVGDVACCGCAKPVWWRSMYCVRRSGPDAEAPIESTLSIANDLLEHNIVHKQEALRLMATSAYCSTCVSALHAAKAKATTTDSASQQ